MGNLQGIARVAVFTNTGDTTINKKIPQLFLNRTAVLIATGPSLTEEVVEILRPYHSANKYVAFGCNDSYRLVDFLDVFYACDGAWWKLHAVKALSSLKPECHIWSQADEKVFHGNKIHGRHQNGLCLDNPSTIHFGSNSGYQLLNIAYHYGIRKFLLVGYNMSKVGDKSHFFGEHPKGLSLNSPYKKFISNFDTVQPEVKNMIINCTPNSALSNSFRPGNLKEELELL